jgi:hypothetical protein
MQANSNNSSYLVKLMDMRSTATTAFAQAGISQNSNGGAVFALAVRHIASQRGLALNVVASPPQAEGVPSDAPRNYYVQDKAGRTFDMAGFVPDLVRSPVGPVTYGEGSTEQYLLRSPSNESAFKQVLAVLPRP